jgi:DNA polymerase-1
MKTWLVLDCHYLCWRAFYTTGGLSFGGHQTGTVYGFLRDVRGLQELHDTQNVVFAFDGGSGRRVELFPDYKASRYAKAVGMLPEERESHEAFLTQIRKLRKLYLPTIGFRNILWQEGYEADDVIASVCRGLGRAEDAVVVTADSDLFQLLAPNVVLYNPQKKKAITEKSFKDEWGIPPTLWADVKAIAGCSTDDVPGIRGVGEKTAAKFISGFLTAGRGYNSIVAGNGIWRRNLELTRLPFPGTRRFELQDDEVTPEKWDYVTGRLGMKSLKVGV